MQFKRRSILKGMMLSATISLPTFVGAGRVMAKALSANLKLAKNMVVNRLDANYERLRASLVWYANKEPRYPDTIIRATSIADVQETINYARDQGLKVAIRSSGHSITQSCLRNGGVLLDVSQLRRLEINAEDRTAWVGPGIRSFELINASTAQGLAFPACHTGFVALGGYLLGGGLGWNGPHWGRACQSIIRAEIITAEGERIIVDHDNHPDLLWAIRGMGPGFFGVVVAFQLRLYPTPKEVCHRRYIFAEEAISDVARVMSELNEKLDSRIENFVSLKKNADLPKAPGLEKLDKRGVSCHMDLFTFVDSELEADAILAPLIESELRDKVLLASEKRCMRFQDLYRATKQDALSVIRTTVENMWTDQPDRSLLAYADVLKNTSNDTETIIAHFWGVNRAHRTLDGSAPYFADHYVFVAKHGSSSEDVEENYRWLDRHKHIVKSYAKGHYINETEYRRYPERIKASYGEENWRRISVLRKHYDPKGVFHGYMGYDV